MLKNLDQISPLSENVISFLTSIVSEKKVNKIIVFGSRAFGDYEKYSDLDLAIDAPLLTKGEWLKLKEYAYYDVKTVIQLSLVHFNTNPIRLQKHILTTGKIIYVK